MGKIDKVKETLNTLRVAMSIAFGILVVLIGSLVKRYDAAKIDTIFWTGFAMGIILMAVIVGIMIKISKKTKEIEDL